MCIFEKIICPSCEGKLEYIGVKNHKWTFKCTNCKWEGDSDFKYIKYNIDYRNLEKRCNQCGAKEGDIHDFFCEVEYCPFCGNPLMLDSCTCLYENLGYDPQNLPEYFYSEGWSEKDKAESLKYLEKKGRIPNIHYPNICFKCGTLWPININIPWEEWKEYLPKNVHIASVCHDCYEEIKKLVDQGKNKEITRPKMCAYCGKIEPKPANASKEEWKAYIEPRMREKILCQKCYDTIKSKIEKYRNK